MKAERRHELQENALVSKISGIGEFLKRRVTYIAWGAVAVAVVVAVVLFVRSHRRAQSGKLQSEFNALTASMEAKPADWLQRMQAMAEQDRDPVKAALACAAIGDEFRQQSQSAATGAPADAPQQAEAYYRKAVQSGQTLAIGKGHYGLAKLAENRGDVAAANAEYDAIINDSSLAGQPVVVLAKLDKAALELRPASIAMVARKPTTEPSSMPSSRPSSLPASAPAVGTTSRGSVSAATQPAGK